MSFFEDYLPDAILVSDVGPEIVRPLFEKMGLIPRGDDEVMRRIFRSMRSPQWRPEFVAQRLAATAHFALDFVQEASLPVCRGAILTAIHPDKHGRHFQAILREIPERTRFSYTLIAGWNPAPTRLKVSWEEMLALVAHFWEALPSEQAQWVLAPADATGRCMIAMINSDQRPEVSFKCWKVH